jgi:hypothetical protein
MMHHIFSTWKSHIYQLKLQRITKWPQLWRLSSLSPKNIDVRDTYDTTQILDKSLAKQYERNSSGSNNVCNSSMNK